MSAVIAGHKCGGCGKQYYMSLGHPKWYDDVVRDGKPEGESFKAFRKMRESGMCPACYLICYFGELEEDEEN